MFAILLSSGTKWMPLQDILIRHMQRPMVRDPGRDEPQHVHRLLTPCEVETKPAFYRDVNSSTESSITQAKMNGVFPWRSANKLPRPNDTCELWEYAVPIDLADRFQNFLTAEEVAMQWTSLANPEKVFVLLQAKPGKGGGGSNTAVQGPESLALKLATSVDEEMVQEEELSQDPCLQHLFPIGVLHLKYRRLVTVADDNQIGELARKLWQGGRFLLKRITTDTRVRFARRQDTSPHHGARDDPPAVLLEGQMRPMAPARLSKNVPKKYATLFGVFCAFQPQSANTHFGKSSYIVTYVAPDSAIPAHQWMQWHRSLHDKGNFFGSPSIRQ